MPIRLALNLEYSRHHNMSFEAAVAKAAELGYEHVEPMVHLGRQLLSEGGFLHSVSMSEDPLRIREVCESQGVTIPSLSSHSHLCKPDFAVEYLKQGIRFAAELGASVVNTSEGYKRPWTTEQEDITLIRYGLKESVQVAERRNIMIGLEPHHQYSASIEGMDRLLGLVDSPNIGVNFDTGNAYLANQSDIYEWLEHVLNRLIHVHAKDISHAQSDAERGEVQGTPVGCACGEGVIDWRRIIDICAEAPHEVVFSVECGTVDEAERSLSYLRKLL